MDVIKDWELVASGVFQLHDDHQLIVQILNRKFVFRYGTAMKADPYDSATGLTEYTLIKNAVGSLEFDVGGVRHFLIAQMFEVTRSTPWVSYFVQKPR